MALATYYLPQMNQRVKMGRIKPRVRPLMALHLRNYLLNSLAPPPANVDYTPAVDALQGWLMYLNDRLGDCVIADGGHEIGCWTANENNEEAVFSDDVIEGLYSTIGGYDPNAPPDANGDNPTDNGCYITDLLNYLTVYGYPATPPAYPNPHTIAGYVGIDSSNQSEVKQGCYLFGTVTLGLLLPDSWVQQAQPNFSWDVDIPNPKNGHCVPVVGYNEQGVQIVTWGEVGTITWAALSDPAIVDEAYVKISNDWYNGDKPSPQGVNLSQLKADLAQLKLS